MANGSGSRRASKWLFDRDTYTHFSKVCPLCGHAHWKEKSVTIIYSVEIIASVANHGGWGCFHTPLPLLCPSGLIVNKMQGPKGMGRKFVG